MGRSELDARLTSEGPGAIPSEEMAAWVVAQRWFGAKSREFAQFNVLDLVILEAGPPLLALLLVEVRLAAGTHELYQLPIVTRDGVGRPRGGGDRARWTTPRSATRSRMRARPRGLPR